MAANNPFTKPMVEMIPANGNNYGPRSTRTVIKITGVILHATQGSRKGTILRFQDPAEHASCHYLIDKSGAVVQFVPDDLDAWHCGNSKFNRQTIGIEIEAMVQDKDGNWLEKPDGFTEAQYSSLLKLSRWLVGEYDIEPVHTGRKEPLPIGFRAHQDVPDPHEADLFGGSRHHKDPGPFFPWWDRLFKDLTAPQGRLTGNDSNS